MMKLPRAIGLLATAALAAWAQILSAAAPALPPPPPIAARGYILMDFQTGQTLARLSESHQTDDRLRGVPGAEGKPAQAHR